MQAVALEKHIGVLVAPAAVLSGRVGALRSSIGTQPQRDVRVGLEKRAKAVRELFKGFSEQTSGSLSESID